ncbi:MAG: arabinose-5-phosphate isomerase [Rhodospirillaceae bacterium]|nr:MAG: arabinose-5-phosphate isomerase [Rhodospirillaceae bacterium]
MTRQALVPICSEDALLNGRVRLRQPEGGYRVAIDSVLLAAAVPVRPGERVADIGTGTGAAALCLLARVPESRVTGVELQPVLAEHARINGFLNGHGARFTLVTTDILHRADSADFGHAFDHVMSNPPFAAAGTSSPDPVRAVAHGPIDIKAWIAACLDVLRPHGTITLIYRANALDHLLAILAKTVGGIEVIPLWPRAGQPARRLIVRGRKGSRGPAILHAGLVLHTATGYTVEAENILRHGHALGETGKRLCTGETPPPDSFFREGNTERARMPEMPEIEQDDIVAARRVLEAEAAALTALAATLGSDFGAALDLITAASGRVVVSGMGKSGHVARKIAATLASTGTPAFFVHPAEASHGDLGMIARGDVVMALSNSGETGELSDLVAYTRRFAAGLIAITRRRDSSLGQSATVTLVLPTVAEACPLGLAPTTSTTMMLALGDAIAVALLARRGFSADDFHLFHPGGTLGQKLLKVSDIMHRGDDVPLVPATLPMTETILVITRQSLGCAGVVDADGVLLGVITDGDLRRHMTPDLFTRTAGAVMTSTPKGVRANMLADEALRLMNDNKITSLFVLADDHRPVGLVHVHDCLRAGVA